MRDLVETWERHRASDSMKIGRFIAVALALFFSIRGTHALDPSQRVNTYLNTRFTTDDGLPSNIVESIVQSDDGFLWSTNGSMTELVRFDGRRFTSIPIPARTMAIGSDGDLWVASGNDLKEIPASALNQFGPLTATTYHTGLGPDGHIICLHLSRSGILWAGTTGGLYRLESDALSAVLPQLEIYRIEETSNGHLLVITSKGFMEWDGSRVTPHPEIAAELGVRVGELFHVMEDSHGVTWFCTVKGVARRVGGLIEKIQPWGGETHAAFRVYEDPQGGVWIAGKEGLFRATAAGMDLAIPHLNVNYIYADRDGDLWIGTNGDGLIRLRDRTVRMFTTADGLASKIVMTVLASHDGTLWAGSNCGGLSHFDGRRFRVYKKKDGLLNECVWSLAEDANHDLWIGTYGGGVFRLHGGRFTQYSKPQGLASDVIHGIVPANDRSIWLATPTALIRLRNGKARNYTTADGLSSNHPLKLYEDRTGRIWVGTVDGIDRLAGDQFVKVSAIPSAPALPIGDDRSGGLYVGLIPSGVLRLEEGRANEVIPGMLATNMTRTAQGDVWFNGSGILRVSPDSLVQQRAHDEPLDSAAFGVGDGMLSIQGSSGYPNSALTPDGKFWVATVQGIAMLDLPRLPRTERNPAIYIEEVVVGRDQQLPGRQLVLPPGTHHAELQFDAVEISFPEKIKLQYRLDGVDSEWLDVEPPAHAVYTNIPPGTHAFHVRACNRDGIWDRTGMVYIITQQPYFYQTVWFLVAAVATGLLLLGGLFRLRLLQATARLNVRFDERLAERTRLARELHDTFIQTVQGTKLIADHARRKSSDTVQMHRDLDELSDWLDRAIDEGRAALNSLRTSTTEKNDLADALQRATEDSFVPRAMAVRLSVIGDSREMHPVVRDEVYRIGYEAIRNACMHSAATQLEIDLRYGQNLTLRVADNGVGIDSAVADRGKDGHFGLQGMRERAVRIGGKLTLVSSSASGTEIELFVPGEIIFQKPGPARQTLLAKIGTIIKRIKSNPD